MKRLLVSGERGFCLNVGSEMEQTGVNESIVKRKNASQEAVGPLTDYLLFTFDFTERS